MRAWSLLTLVGDRLDLRFDGLRRFRIRGVESERQLRFGYFRDETLALGSKGQPLQLLDQKLEIKDACLLVLDLHITFGKALVTLGKALVTLGKALITQLNELNELVPGHLLQCRLHGATSHNHSSDAQQ
jgi:hypothetical protein